MKKTAGTIILFICSLFIAPSFAYISGKMPREEKAYYCPSSINCTSNNLDSCNFDLTVDKEYFGKLELLSSPPLSRLYSFSSARTSYHTNAINGACKYSNINTGKTDLILEIKPEANLEAYNKRLPGSAWVTDGSQANCQSSNPSSCPLKKRYGFVIHNVDLTDGVLASINDNDISPLITEKIYASIYFDEALSGCSNVRECSIDLLSKNHVGYGSVTVDMDTMNILQVSQGEPTVEINKIDSFNIELKKTDRERAINCPSEIKCKNDDINSCTFESPDRKYFTKLDGKLSEKKSQSFQLYSAYNDRESIAFFCEYRSSPPSLGHVRLLTQIKAYLDPYYSHPYSQWKKFPKEDECIAATSESCPFKQRFGFIVNNIDISNGVIVSRKGKDIKKPIIPGYYIITHDDVLPGCSGEKECTIDLLTKDHAKYGSATVNMDTMKITQANSLYPSKVEIKKVDDELFSTVEINYPS